MSASVLLLLSGGMDSTTCLWWLRSREIDVHTIGIDYGQRHRVELDCAASLSKRAGALAHQQIGVDLAAIGGNPLTDATHDVPAASEGRQAATVVPFRNLVFTTAAAAYAETRGIRDIYIALVRDDHQSYRDCRREFYDSLEQTLQLGSTQGDAIALHTPFVDMWKTEVVARGLELHVPYEQTHTCYTGRRPACGECDACVERIAAFRANGASDPLAYEIAVDWSASKIP